MSNEAPSGRTQPYIRQRNINFLVNKTPVDIVMGNTPTVKVNGFQIFSGSDLDNILWLKELKTGILPLHVAERISKEARSSPEEVSGLYADAVSKTDRKNSPYSEAMRAIRIVTEASKCFKLYIDGDRASTAADRLEKLGRFFAVRVPEGTLERLTLYTFDGKKYTAEGEQWISEKLEGIRKAMQKTWARLRIKYLPVLKEHIEKIRKEIEEENQGKKPAPQKTKALIIDLCALLNEELPLEIHQRFRHEIALSLAARTLVDAEELNKPPLGYLFSIAVRNGLLLGKIDNHKFVLELRHFTPDLLITRMLDVSFDPGNVEITEHAKEWFDFTQSVFGPIGVLQFYEFAGYALVGQFPLPTERSILYMVADPGTGKGTHLNTLEGIFRDGTTSFYAHASPQKLCDTREHFSLQNLSNKMMVIDGDIPHKTIADYSPVNNLFGGETIEIEKKFKDPILIAPTLKAIWASAPPLHKIRQAGGLFRRALVLQGRSATREDPKIKPKLTSPEYRNGFLLNMIIGLAWLVSQQWVFTNEPSTEEVQELLEELADSAGVFLSENFVPSDDENDWTPIPSLYERYTDWCGRKQIEAMAPKAFTKAVRNYSDGAFKIEKKKIGSSRGTHVCIKDISDMDDPADPKIELDTPPITWKAFISQFPEIKSTVSDSFGQITHVRDENENKKDHDHDIVCPNESDTPPNVSGNAVFQGLRETKKVSISNSETIRATDGGEPPSKENLNTDPVNSDVQSENPPITEKEGKLFVDQFLNLGYHIDPNSGPDINRRYFKIGVLAIRSLPSDKREKLEYIMQQEHFTLFNSGSMGIFWYIRPLIDGTKEGPHVH
jgi:phage/plasmid-associated DNA primase